MGKVVKINITLPEEELREVDAFIQMQGDTRSGFIRRAMQFFYIEQKGKEKKEKEKREGMAKAASQIKQLKEKSGEWDGAAEIRNLPFPRTSPSMMQPILPFRRYAIFP